MSEDSPSTSPSEGPDATPGPDATQPHPPTPPPAADDTVVSAPGESGPSGTSVMPAVAGPGAAGVPGAPGEEAPRWSARAQVRPPGQPGGDDWEGPPIPPPGRGPLTPVLITLAVLVVAAIIVAALLLVLRNRTPEPPVTTPSLTASPSASPTPTATPTTVSPTAAPTTSAAANVIEIPPVAGATFDDAANALRGKGLTVQRRDQSSPDVPAGVVIGTDPPAGTLVLAGFRVTVIVSTGPPPPPPTTAETTTTPPA